MIPSAPWILHGEATAFLASPTSLRLLVNYRDSPVGPYLEHALITLTRRGPHVFQMSVNLEASKQGGREIWGFPKTLETLGWKDTACQIDFSRENQRFRVRKTGLHFPLALPFWTTQELNGQPVRVDATVRAQARIGFRGRQLAVIFEDFEMVFAPPKFVN
ncbi:MAG TPA: hypothetical protein VGB45_12415 [Abditibacterium sp.]|jgi:hypothetical protein